MRLNYIDEIKRNYRIWFRLKESVEFIFKYENDVK